MAVYDHTDITEEHHQSFYIHFISYDENNVCGFRLNNGMQLD